MSTRRTNGKVRLGRDTFTADHVVFSAAALGTQRLLHRMRDQGRLPHLSPRLGQLTRTLYDGLGRVKPTVENVEQFYFSVDPWDPSYGVSLDAAEGLLVVPFEPDLSKVWRVLGRT